MHARSPDPLPRLWDPDARIGEMPAGRLVDIAEVGRVVAFLVGPASSGMTGDTIHVDGGLHNMG